ncbi:PLP-dependent transferase [Hyaloscypha variabilis]
MPEIQEFNIDKWSTQPIVEQYGVYSYVSALSLNELQQLALNTNTAPLYQGLELTYGTTLGSVRLREQIAELHSSPDVRLTAADIYPTFGQLYLLPKYNGVDVGLWGLKETDGWLPDLEELADMIKPSTKVIIICNPNSPTGIVLPRDTMEQVLALAQKHNIVVFTDEVHSPLFHTNEPRPPPLVSLGSLRTISTASVSKAHGLPGIRVGWVVSQDKEILRRVITLRDYTTISVSLLDDSVAAFALSREVLPKLIEYNLRIYAESITLLDKFIESNAKRSFVQILNKDKSASDNLIFSKKLVKEVSITVKPGSYSFAKEGANDLKGYVRIELGSPRRLQEALVVLEEFLHKYDVF